MNQLHVYHIADTEWWVGESLESILDAFRKQVGDLDAAELLADSNEPSELDQDQWNEMKITEIDEPGHPQHTFREAVEECVKNGQIPCCIASSEY